MIHLTWLRRHSETCAVLALLVFAAALRFYKLDAQSLWYDEGNSARIAERSVQLIIEGAAGDIHPPLYYLILKFWRSVLGSSEWGLRSLSAVCGVLLVLFTFLIGRTWLNRHVAFVAAVLVSVSPFGIYYSQETRMYALLAVWAAMSNVGVDEIRDWGLGIGDWGVLCACHCSGVVYPVCVSVCDGGAGCLCVGVDDNRASLGALLGPVCNCQCPCHRSICTLVAHCRSANFRLGRCAARLPTWLSSVGCATLACSWPHAAAE